MDEFGCTVTLILDNSVYPLPEPSNAEDSAAPEFAVTAFSFGLQTPSGLALFDYNWADTIIDDLCTSSSFPWHLTVQEAEGGVIGGVILDRDLSRAIPAGVSHALLHLHFTTTDLDNCTGEFVLTDVIGNPPIENLLTTPAGAVRPYLTSCTAAFGDLADESATAEPFPAPRSEELEARWLPGPVEPAQSSASESLSEGNGSMAATSSVNFAGHPNCAQFPLTSSCECPEALLGAPLPLLECAATDVFCVPSDYPSIQDAVDFINQMPVPPTNSYILVDGGTYGPVSITQDITNWILVAVNPPTPGLGNPAIIHADATNRAISVLGISHYVQIGIADSEDALDPTQWHGFIITQPNPTVPTQGGVITNGNNCYVQGNVIQGLLSDGFQATGVQVQSCGPCPGVAPDTITISHNLISNNTRRVGGTGGVGVGVDGQSFGGLGGQVIVAKNVIEGNRRETGTVIGDEYGGGVYANSSNVRLCYNVIRDNDAKMGAGVAIFPNDDACIHIEGNIVENNRGSLPVSPSQDLTQAGMYQGAGVWIRAFANPSIAPYEIHLWNNVIKENFCYPVGSTNLGTFQGSRGGGLYMELFQTGFRGSLVGNLISGNRAYGHGAGVWFGNSVADDFTRIWNNTILGNTSLQPATPLAELRGTGIYLDASSRFCRSSNIVFGNSPPGRQWYWTCPIDSDPWVFSQLEAQLPPPALCPFDLGGDFTEATDPRLNPDDAHIASSTTISPCVDTADPFFSCVLVSGEFLPVSEDIDGEDREIPVWPVSPLAPDFPVASVDRGGDEFWSPPFIRGDAEPDGAVNLSDAVKVMCYLFPPSGVPCAGVGCLDALDCNDDGTVNLPDAVYLLTYLFPPPGLPGPPPPHPWPSCGWDLTTDFVGPCQGEPNGPCPDVAPGPDGGCQ